MNRHGVGDSGPGTTKHYLVAARIEEVASRGKYDMFGKKRPAPSGDYLDRVAEQKLSGGFNLRKSNLCDRCWTYKSTNGKCGC
jgi:hypothetical protein